MASLKEIRLRIASVQGTRQITSAMKMVSAAKLRKAQDNIIRMRPYANKLNKILSHLTYNLGEDSDIALLNQREENRVLIIAISSNKGLCGAFNSNVARKTLTLLENDYRKLHSEGKAELLLIGRKVFDVLKNKGFKIKQTRHEILDKPNFEVIRKLAEEVMSEYEKGKYDKVLLIYNQFRNAAVQTLVTEQFLPMIPVQDQEPTGSNQEIYYILEPSKKSIVRELIPKALRIQFYKAFLDSLASEHGARMTAMHSATDNATEIIRSLQLEYNKARQAAITKEILEIVGGANALKA